MRRGLGFVAVIAATGGPSNPVGIAVSIGAGVAFVVSRFLHPGEGRKEADYLTDPETGAQTHAGEALSQVIDFHNAHPELWSEEEITGVIDAIEKIRDDFVAYAGQFVRAGPGAIATIEALVDALIRDRRRELAQLQGRENENGLPAPGAAAARGGTMNIRLYLVTSPTRIDTGLVPDMVYPELQSLEQLAMFTDVDSRQFGSMPQLIDYAAQHNEQLARVGSADEVLAIVRGTAPLPTIDVAAGDSSHLLMAGAIGIGGFFLLKKFMKRRSA